ncbi:hypothetical protein DPMN_015099 [Dreissena polymorpha]|uniref:Uncharacterized protein n=1 Tax=Dreissena polymorpha TaxID=45954 RepID=A0A9D4NAK9_DREPO|nr:hypothetical protein DPMN_015099 [Dreissena polymorpha]
MERFAMVLLCSVCLNGLIGYTNSLPINDALVNKNIRSNAADLQFLEERILDRIKRALCKDPKCCFCDGTTKDLP